MTRPRLVDPKFLVKPRIKISKPKKAISIKYPEFSIQMILSIIFGIGIIYFIWYCSNMEPLDKPDLDFLPENIRNNEFFGKYQSPQKKEKYQKKIIKCFNQDQLEINLKTF